MFKYFILVFLCLIFQIPEKVFGQQFYPVKRTEFLEPDNLKKIYPQKQQSENIEFALLWIEKFLEEDDFSLIYSDSAIAKQIKNLIKITENPEHTLFEIIGINSVTDQQIICTINLYLYFEKVHYKEYKGSFKIGFNVQQKKVIFPMYNSEYITKKYYQINFHVNKALSKKYASNMLKADTYVLKFIGYLNDKYPNFYFPHQKLNYLISDGNFNSLDYFGFTNYFDVSKYLKTKDSNLIVDVSAKGFFKHELIHYVLSEYKLNFFLSEGLATLLSGGQGRFETSSLTEWDAIRERIKSDQKYRAAIDNPDSLLDLSHAHEMYFTGAALLYRYYLKLGDKIFFKQLFETLVTFNNKEVLALIKKELNIVKLSTYLESIDNDSWRLIKSDFEIFHFPHSTHF